MSDRQMALWETGSLGNLKMEVIDSSSYVAGIVGRTCHADRPAEPRSGVLMPFFADGNDVLFLAGKGWAKGRRGFMYGDADEAVHSATATSATTSMQTTSCIT